MKQKNCFWAVAATMLLAAASFTSCSNQDNIITPELPDTFDEGSMITNGRCEGSSVENFFVQVGKDGVATNGAIPATIKWDEVTPKNHCIVVEVRSEAEARDAGNAAVSDWMTWVDPRPFAAHDTQFFVSIGESNALNEKDQIRITMDVMADAEFSAGTGAHAAPGEYLDGLGKTVEFTPEWKAFDSGWVTLNEKQAGMYSIAFDLADATNGNARRVFFDNIRVEVKRADPEPVQIDGYKVVVWNLGTADENQFSVKYFKNYVAPKSEDGAIVVESLEPQKNYNKKYYMEDDNGKKIDAVLTRDWDTQFLISLPKPLEKGTKGKLVMKVKADYAANGQTQCHKAIPAPGAIEKKTGYEGTYMWYSLMGDIPFTTEWATIEKDFTVPDNGDGMQSICLNLNVFKDGINKYYFDEITVYVEKEFEPEEEDGWDIVTWTVGKNGSDATKFQVKYFKNYVAAKSENGAIVVTSLEPDKNYNGTYHMEDDNGNTIDATLSRNWDTQFLIGLPAPVARGTKMKLSMMVKADKATSGESQVHGVLPSVGAVETKQGDTPYAGTYIHYSFFGNVDFTTEWKQFDKEFTVPADGKGDFQSICLNLDVLKEVNKYYFKNIVVRVAK